MPRLPWPFVGALLVAATARATPGAITRPASAAAAAVLDPNGDGYVSATTAGFGSAASESAESELVFHRLPLASEPAADARAPGAGLDLVDGGAHAAYVRHDAAAGALAFRMRFDGEPAGASLLIDTDGLLGPADPDAVPGNPGFERELVVTTGPGGGVALYDVAGRAALADFVALGRWPLVQRTQVAAAATSSSGDADALLDGYLLLADAGLSASTPLRFAAAATSSGTALGGLFADAAGSDDAAAGGADARLLGLASGVPAVAPLRLGSVGGFPCDAACLTPPAVLVPADGAWIGAATPTASGTAPAGARVVPVVDGREGPAVTALDGIWAAALGLLADGPHGVEAWAAKDGATSAASARVTFFVDTLAPETTLDLFPPAASASRFATFVGSASEPAATFECAADGASFAPCAFPLDLRSLADGTHTMLVRARDLAGNVDPTPAAWTWDVDAPAPETAVSIGPAEDTRSTSARFVLTSDQPFVTFECAMDGGSFAACEPDFTLAGLAEGAHQLLARASDGVEADPTPAAWAWVVDLTPPMTRIVAGPDPVTSDTSAGFRFEASEPGCRWECARDMGPFTACAEAWALDSLGHGPHVLRVRATDRAGNLESPGASWAWTVIRDADRDRADDLVEVRWGLDPADADSDDDGVMDGDEPRWSEDTDGDGLVNGLDPDSDDDGLLDGTELGVTAAGEDTRVRARRFVPDADPATRTDPLARDGDGGGASDGAEDPNRNGRVDPGESDPSAPGDDGTPADADRDGLPDALERSLGSDPADDDSDDDGVPDGREPNPGVDGDLDGAPGVLDFDADDDGLHDGTEMGVTLPASGTDPARGHFVPDRDPGSRTCPLLADTDGGGVPDGAEDHDHDGLRSADETHPAEAADDPRADADEDGAPDDVEARFGTDPADPDSDDDGLLDGLEPGYLRDTDGDGLRNPLDPDSDDDGLPDGLEAGVAALPAGTDAARRRFRADEDPATTTHVLIADGDGDGLPDGSEDADADGRVDGAETDPADGADAARARDTDGDGLTDLAEARFGSSPRDLDSDDDGVPDAREPNPALDLDGDGRNGADDADSDGDGLLDGTELGLVAPAEGTDVTLRRFVADADPTTRTSPALADSDGGGTPDGLEDASRDGRVDEGERDPNDASDDRRGEASLVDDDGDGVPDARDGCPTRWDPSQADRDGDGRGDACDFDADGDGLVDGVGVAGGGCAAASGGLAAALVALVTLGKRRRRA